jgi:hypothetical protein
VLGCDHTRPWGQQCTFARLGPECARFWLLRWRLLVMAQVAVEVVVAVAMAMAMAVAVAVVEVEVEVVAVWAAYVRSVVVQQWPTTGTPVHAAVKQHHNHRSKRRPLM